MLCWTSDTQKPVTDGRFFKLLIFWTLTAVIENTHNCAFVCVCVLTHMHNTYTHLYACVCVNTYINTLTPLPTQ